MNNHGGPRPGAGRPPLAEPTDAAGVVEWLARRKTPIRATVVDGCLVLTFDEAMKLCRLAGMGR